MVEREGLTSFPADSIVPRKICLPNERARAGSAGEPKSGTGANDAQHWEHLMVPARQLTSQAQTLRASGWLSISLWLSPTRRCLSLVPNEACRNGNRHTPSAKCRLGPSGRLAL